MLERGLSQSFVFPIDLDNFSDDFSELPQLKRVFYYFNPALILLTVNTGACRELNINPKISLIIVGKRHNIRFVMAINLYSCHVYIALRFFPQKPKDADKSENCPAGTVVDRDITHPTDHDFYLQSHAGLKGTSRPAHYYV